MITLLINTLGALGLINGLSQKQISDMYVTLITPSPATFSIWSIIYLLLLTSVIVMIVKKDDSYYKSAIEEITVLFRISCILNVAWIVTFSLVQIELSVIFILGFVIVLSLICLKLKKIQVGNHRLLPLTFGLYTGWLFIATVVNIAAALVKLKWNGFGINDEIWAITILIIAVILAFLVLQKNRNAAFPLPLAWGYFGIYKFLESPQGFNNKFVFLQIIALVGMAVLIGMAAVQLYLNHFELLPEKSD
ncbi:TspO/MBR family protein [Clostridium sp.]|uniref:TspO/MBR family protein n=1 Tax=Clostridium sp. TaxID=1506 RepID=UPI003D6CBE96